MERHRSSRFHGLRTAALLFFPALALRLVFNLVLHPPGGFIFSDMRGYESSAGRILAGSTGPEDTFTPSGYPTFLAALYAVSGHSHRLVAVVQALLGASVCVLGWRLSERVLGSKRLALVVGIGCIFYAPYIYYGGLLSTEALATFLLALAATALTEVRDARKPYLWLCLAGGSLGALTVVRPNAALAFPVVGAFLWLSTPKASALRYLGALFAAAAPLPLYAALRNSLLLGHAAGIATNGGLNFFLAHTAHMGVSFSGPNGSHMVVPIRNGLRYAAEGLWISPVPLHDERFFYHLGFGEIAKRPWELLRALDNIREGIGAGVQSYWPGWTPPSTRAPSMVLQFFSRAFLSLAFIPATLRIVLLLRARSFKEHAGHVLLAGIAASSLVTMYLFLGDPRVRVPFDLAFWVLAVDGAAIAARRAKLIGLGTS